MSSGSHPRRPQAPLTRWRPLTGGAPPLGFPPPRPNWEVYAEAPHRRPAVVMHVAGLPEALCTEEPPDAYDRTYAYRLDGGPGYLRSVGTGVLTSTGDLSLVMVLRVVSATAGAEYGLLAEHDGTSLQRIAVGLAYDGGSNWRMRVHVPTNTGTHVVAYSSTLTLTMDRWWVVSVGLGGQGRTRIEGVVIDVASGEEQRWRSTDTLDPYVRTDRQSQTAAARTYLGASSAGSEVINAEIAYAAVYDRALQPREMRQLAYRRVDDRWPHQAALRAQWLMDEGAGSRLRSTGGQLSTWVDLEPAGSPLPTGWVSSAAWSPVYRTVLGWPESIAEILRVSEQRSSIGGARVQVLDEDGWMTSWLARTAAWRGSHVAIWWGWSGLPESDYELLLVGELEEIEGVPGVGYELTIGDLRRRARTTGGRLLLARTRLTADVDSSTTTFPVVSTSGWLKTSIGAAAWLRYARIDDEIVEVNTLSSDTSMAVTRGLFGTSAAAHAAGATVAEILITREQSDWTHPIDIALSVLTSPTGDDYDGAGYDVIGAHTGSTTYPDGRGSGLSRFELDLEAWERARDTELGEGYVGIAVVSEDIDDVWDWVERQILRPLGYALGTDRLGRLTVIPWAARDASSAVATLDPETTIVREYGIDHEQVRNAVVIRADRGIADGSSWGTVAVYEDADSSYAYGRAELDPMDLDWARTHVKKSATDAPVARIDIALLAQYVGTVMSWTVAPGHVYELELPARWRMLRVGDTIIADLARTADWRGGIRYLQGALLRVVERRVDLRRASIILRCVREPRRRATAWAYAGGYTETGSGSAWTNPGEALGTPGGSSAVGGDSASSSRILVLHTYGLSVPSGATVRGIEVQAKIVRSTRDVPTLQLAIGTTLIGANRAIEVTSAPGFWAWTAYGGVVDLWGANLAPSDVGNLGVAWQAPLAGVGEYQLRIDACRVRVWYEL